MSGEDDEGGGAASGEQPQKPSPFSPEELEEFRMVFKDFDRDGDKTIDIAELGKVMQELGAQCTAEMLEDMIASVDADGTGAIDFDEFVELMARKTLGEMQEEAESALAKEEGEDRESVDEEQPQEELPARTAVALLSQWVSRLEATAAADDDPEADDDEQSPPGTPIAKPEPLSVPDAVREAQAHRLLTAPEGIPELTVEQLLEMTPGALAEYLGEVLAHYRAILSDEEDWALVHNEDDDAAARPLDGRPSALEVDRLVGELEGFRFARAADPKLALGAEAYVLAAKAFPFFMFPIASVIGKLTDAAIQGGNASGEQGLLDVSMESLHDKGAVALAEVVRRDALRRQHPDKAVSGPPIIRKLIAKHNFISPAGGAVLVEALCVRDPSGKGALVSLLDLSHNALGHRAAHLPREPQVLREMRERARENQLAAQAPQPVPDPQSPPRMAAEELAAGRERLTDEWRRPRGIGRVLRNLLDGPKASEALKILRLTHNRLGDADARLIALGLHENGTLVELDLSHNDLGVSSARSLAVMLQNNSELKRLIVAWNKFEQTGADALLRDGLMRTASLEVIDMSFTGIQDVVTAGPDGQILHVADAGGKLLGKVLETDGLRKVNVAGNKIGPSGAAYIGAALRQNSSLVSLNISHNPLTGAGAKRIIQDVSDNKTLDELNMTATLAGPNHEECQDRLDVYRALREANKRRAKSDGPSPVIIISYTVQEDEKQVLPCPAPAGLETRWCKDCRDKPNATCGWHGDDPDSDWVKPYLRSLAGAGRNVANDKRGKGGKNQPPAKKGKK